MLPDGTARKVRRTLKADYGKKQDCESILEIDGKAAPESALQTFGIGLSQPPLRAPVLAQHTLGYLFSARPQERATYFKALLEVGDLEICRGEVASLKDGLDTDGHPLARKLETAAAVASAAPDLKPLLAKPVDGAAICNALSAAMAKVITSGGGAPPDSYEERLAAIRSLLAEKRALTFPMKAFERKTLPSWTAPPEEQFAKLERYIAERAKIDEETRRLTNLFREALAIPDVKDASDPLECPLCASPESLTPARIAYIAQKLAETDDFRKAEGAARAALIQIESALGSFETGLAAALPLFLSNASRTRRARGFRVASIRVLLGTEREENIRDWLRAARGLMRAYSAAARLASQLKALAAGHAADLDKFSDAAALKTGVLGIAEAAEAVARALGCYGPAQEVVVTPLAARVDAASKTTGWQELIEIAGDREGLRRALIERSAIAELQKEVGQALKQIDKGNEAVLDDKFTDLSESVQTWWDLLRPGELSFFSAVGPRAGARRTIDFKAGLAVNADRSDAKLRDVIAVFSQSQLHCLGLALFLGKTLGQLSPLVEPLLGKDPSHPGKLRTIGGAVNPAKHDDSVPAGGVLKVAIGDLRFLKKTYL